MQLMANNSLENEADENESLETDVVEEENYTLAIVAECLYLTNLLFFPGLAFLVLSLLYFTNKQHPSAVVRCHLKQTFFGSIWAGVMIGFVSIAILYIGGLDEVGSWIVGVLYFLSIHALLIYMGAFGLASAINGKNYRFHFIGPECSD